MQVTTIGLDIAKNVFQVHGIDATEKVVVRRRASAARPCSRSPACRAHPAACINVQAVDGRTASARGSICCGLPGHGQAPKAEQHKEPRTSHPLMWMVSRVAACNISVL
jgi:hypothetical protein